MGYEPNFDDVEPWTDEEIDAMVAAMEEEEKRRKDEEEWAEQCIAEQQAYWDEHPEEFDAMVARMEEQYYTELWQYVGITHTDKDNGRLNANATSWKVQYNANGTVPKNYQKFQERGLPYVRLHSFCFDELVDASKKGATFKRVPQPFDGGKHATTRFVIVDIDNDPMLSEKDGYTPEQVEASRPNITADELKQLETDTFVVVPSTSGNKYKHHIFIKHPTPISTAKEYKDIYIEYSKVIENAVGRKMKTDYRVCDWSHWFYGNPQDTEHELIFAPSDVTTLQLTKDNPGVKLRPDPKRRERTAPHLPPVMVPDSMSKLLREFGVGAMKAPGFRAWLPWFKRHSTKATNKIPVGQRYTTLMNYMLVLYDFWRLHNYWASTLGGVIYPPEVLVNTFKIKSADSFVKDGEFENKDLPLIMEALQIRINANADISDRDWLNGQYKQGKNAKRTNGDVQRVWRLRGYCESATRYIAEQHGCIDGNTVATFTNRDELNNLLDANLIKYPTFRTYMSKFGFSIKCTERKKAKAYKEHKPHANAKYNHILSGAILVDGVSTYYYNSFNKNESQFAKRHGIQYVKR